jgi:hypothetical protein
LRYRILSAAVAALLAGALAAAGSAQASTHTAKPHDTTVCGQSAQPCTNISSLLLNQNNSPEFVQNATTGQARDAAGDGRRVNLRQFSNTRTNEDFVIKFVGTVGQLCELTGTNSLDPTSYACLVYDFNGGSNYPVYQAQFAPNSNESGACVGAMSATPGFRVRLERCGSPLTFWVGDLAADITITLPAPFQPLVYFPLEFAADSSASNPLVLTLNPNSTGVKNGLYVQPENFSGGHAVDRQMFTLTGGTGFPLRNR